MTARQTVIANAASIIEKLEIAIDHFVAMLHSELCERLHHAACAYE